MRMNYFVVKRFKKMKKSNCQKVSYVCSLPET